VTEYRVAELARAAGTTIRNVRVYQDRGLLAPPRRQGRIGLYDEAQLERLRLIGRLLGRGYTFATLRELFDAWNGGQDLATTLGLREALTAPCSLEQPVRLTSDELSNRFGAPIPPDALRRAGQLGLLIEDGPAYQVPSPSLFDAGAELVAAGVPLEAVLDLAEAQQHDLATVVERFVGVLLTHLPQPPDDPEQPTDLAERVLRLRPYAQRTVNVLLMMAMQQQTDRLLERRSARSES
jgi:DNA-binding transcriptional MerR regulator